MGARYDLINVVSLSIGANSPILKFKQSVGPEEKTNSFSSSNKPQSRINQSLLIFMCYIPQTFCDRIMELFLSKFFINVYSYLIYGLSWSRWETMPIFNWSQEANRSGFKFKRAPKQKKPNFIDFRVLDHRFLTSFTTLLIEPIRLKG
ncbi:hypothetical protein H5410_058917 [Solanum commersonii]|uniref:Uncharacterized protein n=1 Tax=Solanum commersonii TaxID=4109 RepID=A0A9J5W1A6_SOLCO|nr:hypothetical protein H5410_058917 [Solanum commersonii]